MRISQLKKLLKSPEYSDLVRDAESKKIVNQREMMDFVVQDFIEKLKKLTEQETMGSNVESVLLGLDIMEHFGLIRCVSAEGFSEFQTFGRPPIRRYSITESGEELYQDYLLMQDYQKRHKQLTFDFC